MKKINPCFAALLVAMIACLLFFGKSHAQSESEQIAAADLTNARIALMPFLQGQLESADQTIAKPLSKTLSELEVDYRGLPEGSDRIIYRVAGKELKLRFQDNMIPADLAVEAYAKIEKDPTLDTPRKRAVGFGKMLQADIVVVGTVWRFREKGALEDVPDSPASVGFALYLVDVETGLRLWRGTFDGTQKALTEDVLGGIKQLGMGLHWLTAEELARYGVKSLLRKLPS
ncbi:hypothetical protein [Desulfosarcina widdelii]|nr:hypothetical protein [Desulfosarcina widdelii]